jgi:hypothetical protein
MGTPGLGAGGTEEAAAGAVAGEPAAPIEPGLGGVGIAEGFFCCSGLALSSDDDKLKILQSYHCGL